MNTQPEDASDQLPEESMSELATLGLKGLGLAALGNDDRTAASLAALDRLKELGDPHGYRERLKQALRDNELAQIPEIMREVQAYLVSHAPA